MNPNEAAKKIGTELGQSNPRGDARLAAALAQPSETIKRYCYSVVRDVYGIKSAEMVEDANGAYVLHSDYAALSEQRRELLEALQNIENDDGRIPETIWAMRNAAIAKAEGRMEN